MTILLFFVVAVIKLNENLSEKKKEEASKTVSNVWKQIVKEDLMSKYLILLEDELNTKRKKFFEVLVLQLYTVLLRPIIAKFICELNMANCKS